VAEKEGEVLPFLLFFNDVVLSFPHPVHDFEHLAKGALSKHLLKLVVFHA